jgi:hypothetical protein
MGHFRLLVIGANPDYQIIRYLHHNPQETDDPVYEKFEFIDEDDHYRNHYMNGICVVAIMDDGKIYTSAHPMFHELELDEAPSGFRFESRSYSEIYSDMESFMSEEHEGIVRNAKTGRYGRWFNPDAKFDYCSLGGIYSNFYRLKKEFWAECGMDADCIEKEKVDFEAMRFSVEQEAVRQYDAIIKLFDGLPLNTTMEESIQMFGGDAVAGEKYYWSQPRCKAWKTMAEKPLLGDHFYRYYTPDRFLVSKDEYIDLVCCGYLSPFSIVINGAWQECEDQSWWESKKIKGEFLEWIATYEKILNSLPGDTMLSIYDCHY